MHTTLLSNLVITKVFTASTFYSPQNKKGRRNNRSQWALVIKYEGETTYLSEGKRYLSDLNHVVILPKGCSYARIPFKLHVQTASEVSQLPCFAMQFMRI